MRLDLLLQKNFPEFSRKKWKEYIENGSVFSHSRKLKPSDTIPINEIILLQEKIWQEQFLIPNPVVAKSLDLVYDDSDILIYNKPAPLPSHPLNFSEKHTFTNGLVSLFPGLNFPNELESSLLNRLDTETSGLIICGRKKGIEIPKTLKAYVCILNTGMNILSENFQTEWPIAHDQKDSKKVVALGSINARPHRGKGRDALTKWFKIESIDNLSLMCAVISKGQFHQIRAHASALDAPLLYDLIYGSIKRPLDERHQLHAFAMKLNEEIIFADIPKNFHLSKFKTSFFGLKEKVTQILNSDLSL